MRPGGDPDTTQYVYEFLPGERPELAANPDAWTGEDRAVFEQHYAYLQQATAAGTVLLAGRSQDGVGPAFVILRSTSEAEARRFMESDPFVKFGLFRASLHPFRAAFVGK